MSELGTQTPHFDFFQAMRLLESEFEDFPRFGESRRLKDEPIRITQEPVMAFAPSQLISYGPTADAKSGHIPRLNQVFFGLLGVNGPLPLHLTQYARQRVRQKKDHTFRRFLDVFHHRLACLFYRAWASSRPTVSLDRPETDRFSLFVGSLCGLGLDGLKDRDCIPDFAKLHLAGQFGRHIRGAEGLASILRSFFEMPVDVEEFVGHWIQIPVDDQWQLGAPQLGEQTMGELGVSTMVGGRVWDRRFKFRVVVGPIGIDELPRLLPGGRSLRRLVTMVRNYVGDELFWDLKVLVRGAPGQTLGAAPQLGWTSWLNSEEHDEVVDDVIIDPVKALILEDVRAAAAPGSSSAGDLDLADAGEAT
ncbi:MAG: type VI secretion system baseplate subunit TssG [Planctomycetota bacterium]